MPLTWWSRRSFLPAKCWAVSEFLNQPSSVATIPLWREEQCWGIRRSSEEQAHTEDPPTIFFSQLRNVERDDIRVYRWGCCGAVEGEERQMSASSPYSYSLKWARSEVLVFFFILGHSPPLRRYVQRTPASVSVDRAFHIYIGRELESRSRRRSKRAAVKWHGKVGVGKEKRPMLDYFDACGVFRSTFCRELSASNMKCWRSFPLIVRKFERDKTKFNKSCLIFVFKKRDQRKTNTIQCMDT